MTAMSVTDAVAGRRAIRAFVPKTVELDVLTRVLDKARYCPSGSNLQPWQATVLTGEPLRALQEKLAVATPQEPAEYPIVPHDVGAQYTARTVALGAAQYAALGIDRDDEAARTAFRRQNLVGFGAPVLLLCHLPRIMDRPQWSDVGMWLQTVMLLLREEGLDSCPQESLSSHARLIKEHIGVDDATQIFFCGMAIGYRDESRPINNFERPRIPLDQQVSFRGF
jgi:nitroreductase